MRSREGAILLAVVGILIACGKGTSATADSPATASSTTSATFDKNAARAEILGDDSAFVRAMLAKNVDSLMPYYDPSVVSMSEGGKAVKGLSDVRASYNQAVKSNLRDVTFQSGGVNFSDDGTMAWDYGTVSSTVIDPKGKQVKSSGNYLNVWKRVDGHFRIVAEISNSSQ
jgi:ketosteroid isomerase-like protein